METILLFAGRIDSSATEMWLAISSVTAIIGLLGAGVASLLLLQKSILKKEKRVMEIIQKKTEQYKTEIIRLKKEIETNEMLSSVTMNTESGVIIADENGEIIWVNPNFTNKTGYSLAQFKTLHGNTIMEASCHPDIIQIINDALRYKKSVVYESYAYTKHCKKYYISSQLTPIFDDDCQLKRFVVVDTDISKYVALKNELNNIGSEFSEFFQAKLRKIA